MISVLASIKVKPGKVSEFLKIFKANVPAVRKEKGCVEYFPAIDVDLKMPVQKLDGNLVTIIEKWNSPEDLMAHLASPHMADYREKVKDIVESVSVQVLREA